MHLKGLDLNLLVVLDALLAEKNITRTGERIHLSQPATSGALARLRDFFGDPLLIQVGQRMELTPLAEQLAQPVRELILNGESIIGKNQGFRPATSQRVFRLNMSDYSAAVIMNRALRRIHSLAPEVKVEITSLIDEPTSEYLERGYLDLIVTPSEMASPLHPTEHLFNDQLAVVVWNRNPIARNGLTREDYLAGGHIVARFSKLIGFALDEVFLSRIGIQRRVEVVVSSFSMLMPQLIGTHLIATVQERFARYYAQYMPLSVFPCPVPVMSLDVKMQWHRFHESDMGIQWLRKTLREAAAELEPLSPVAPDRMTIR
jgi:LysR family transcriptional regulator, nod-box dependent transcriptional activator